MKKFLLYNIIILASVILLSNCSTLRRFHVKVDSISSPKSMKEISYFLYSGMENVIINDLQFIEYSAYIHKALQEKGYIRALNIENADTVIFLVYGIGDPKEHSYSYSVPTFGQTGISASSTTGTIITSGNVSTFTGGTTYTPTYGITGSKTYTGKYITYFRYIIMDCYDLKKYFEKEELIQLWRTVITSTGSSDDLRRVFPVLIAASSQYIGENTGKMIKVVIFENDKRVLDIKSSLQE